MVPQCRTFDVTTSLTGGGKKKREGLPMEGARSMRSSQLKKKRGGSIVEGLLLMYSRTCPLPLHNNPVRQGLLFFFRESVRNNSCTYTSPPPLSSYFTIFSCFFFFKYYFERKKKTHFLRKEATNLPRWNPWIPSHSLLKNIIQFNSYRQVTATSYVNAMTRSLLRRV